MAIQIHYLSQMPTQAGRLWWHIYRFIYRINRTKQEHDTTFERSIKSIFISRKLSKPKISSRRSPVFNFSTLKSNIVAKSTAKAWLFVTRTANTLFGPARKDTEKF